MGCGSRRGWGVGGEGGGVQLSVLGFAMWVTYQRSKPANNLQKKEGRKKQQAGDSCAYGCSSPAILQQVQRRLQFMRCAWRWCMSSASVILGRIKSFDFLQKSLKCCFLQQTRHVSAVRWACSGLTVVVAVWTEQVQRRRNHAACCQRLPV